MRKGSGAVLILLAVLIVLVIVAGIWYFKIRGSNNTATVIPTTESIANYANWNTYTNATSGYSFKYPPSFNNKPFVTGVPPSQTEVVIGGESSDTQSDLVLTLLTGPAPTGSVESDISAILADPSGCYGKLEVTTTTVVTENAAVFLCHLNSNSLSPWAILDFYHNQINYRMQIDSNPSAPTWIGEIANNFTFTK